MKGRGNEMISSSVPASELTVCVAGALGSRMTLPGGAGTERQRRPLNAEPAGAVGVSYENNRRAPIT